MYIKILCYEKIANITSVVIDLCTGVNCWLSCASLYLLVLCLELLVLWYTQVTSYVVNLASNLVNCYLIMLPLVLEWMPHVAAFSIAHCTALLLC